MYHAIVAATLLGVAAGAPVVDIPGLGSLEGRQRTAGVEVDEFLGVQYATADRWESPVEVKPWNNTKRATAYGNTCPGSRCIRDGERDAEECLYLNIYRPSNVAKGDNIPVMIWVHGGSYTFGCSDQYEGQQMIAPSNSSVIVITMNYRLNVMGFLGSDKMRVSDGSTGNFGLQDQRAAMLWAKKHISNFGGNPNDMTIFGESAGAGAMTVHLTSKKSAGIFTKVIAQSGLGSSWSANSLSKAEATFATVLKHTNCSDVACLKSLSSLKLQEAIISLDVEHFKHFYFAPVVDGVELTALPIDSLRSGDFNKGIPVMAGVNRDEGAAFVGPISQADELLFDSMMLELDLVKSPLDLIELKRLYANGTYEYPKVLGKHDFWWWVLVRALSDQMITCPTRMALRALVQHNAASVNMYANMLSYTAPGTVAVGHGADLKYVFNCQGKPLQSSCAFDNATETAFASTMSSYWSAYAVKGVPATAWPMYDVAKDNHFNLDVGPTGMKTMEHVRTEPCNFWDRQL